MKRILISGYYGFNNAGDEAILRLMIDNLRARCPEAGLTILSHNPEDTARRYGVRSVNRMNPFLILREILRCDLLISGGGSLLQDATSQRSLLYYLSILNLAQALHKKTFIYSQGIGPLNSEANRRRTAASLRRADGIVVRDLQSKELLARIGLDTSGVHVTADPVLRARPPALQKGADILCSEGLPDRQPGRIRVGWAMKSGGDGFLLRQEEAIRWLQQERGADVVLIPFHEAQDRAAARTMKQHLGASVCLLEGHYLSEDLLSAVGNLDVMVGVRLHSMIYAAVMGVPMLGISYDPKIDSFLESIGQRPVSDAEGFCLQVFAPAFDRLTAQRAQIRAEIADRVGTLRQSLDINETLIAGLLEESPC